MKYTKLLIVFLLATAAILSSGCTQQQVTKQENDFMQKYKTGMVVVYFWDDNCRACEIQTGELEATKRSVTFPLVKVKPNDATIAKYNLTAFPTILLFQNGKVVKRFSELTYQNQLVTEIKFLQKDIEEL